MTGPKLLLRKMYRRIANVFINASAYVWLGSTTYSHKVPISIATCYVVAVSGRYLRPLRPAYHFPLPTIAKTTLLAITPYFTPLRQ